LRQLVTTVLYMESSGFKYAYFDFLNVLFF
jgi:hypothetical protein